MWGTLGAESLSKFDLTRQTLRQSLSAVSPEARLGLVSFGHRRRGDCTDAEAIAVPEAGPPDRIPSLVDKLNPKGKGPLTLALREAARLVDPGSPGNVIVIHDGPDNCQQDPCEAAAEISKANAGLVVHVIGLAPEPADAQRMSCVARATKGKMFAAHDAPSLAAAIDEVVNLASLRQDVAPPAPVAVGSRTRVPATGPSGLKLSAALTTNGAPLAAPITWRIAKDGEPAEVVLERTAPEITESLPPGSYAVSASLDLATAQQVVEVGDKGATIARLALDAGVLRLVVRASKALDTLSEPVITILAPSAAPGGEQKARRPVWIGRDPNAEIVVPRGTYYVRVEDGLASRETSVAVKAGGGADAELALATGRLELGAIAYEGGDRLGDVIFSISEDDPDAPQGRREVARSADPNAAFVLAPGTYYVTARHGPAEGRERVALGSGDTVQRTLVLNLARVSLSALLDGAAPPHDMPLTFRTSALDGTSREVARSTSASPDLLLPQGRYRFEAQAGALNVKRGVEADLSPGQEYKIALKLESAQVTITPRDGTAMAASRWELQDGSGHTLLRSGRGVAQTARLAPGRYVVRSEIGDQRSEHTFELKPGEQRTVDIGVP